MNFEVLPEGYDRGTISYLEGERVLKNRGIVAERIRKVFIGFVNSMVKSGDMKELSLGLLCLVFLEEG